MALNAQGILSGLRSHAAALGIFEHVVGHALINPPQSGLAVAFEFGNIRPGAQYSGLTSTSAVLNWTASIYKTMQSQPGDDIEFVVLGAASALINAYSGDFDLDGLIRNIDLLGATGGGLAADGGYFKPGDMVYRAAIITIPMIINDVWDQVS